MSSISGFKSSAKKRKPVLCFIDESLVLVFYSFYITGTFLLKMVSGLLVIGQPKYVVAAALGSPPIFLRPSLFSVSHQISKCRGLQRQVVYKHTGSHRLRFSPVLFQWIKLEEPSLLNAFPSLTSLVSNWSPFPFQIKGLHSNTLISICF